MQIDTETLLIETIQKEINKYDDNQMINYVEDALRNVIIKDQDIINVIHTTLKDNIKKIIDDEVKNYLTKPFVNKNSWSDRETHYDSFEQFFKSALHKEIKSSWDIKQAITGKVKECCSRLVNQYRDEAIKDVSDKIFKLNEKNIKV